MGRVREVAPAMLVAAATQQALAPRRAQVKPSLAAAMHRQRDVKEIERRFGQRSSSE